MGVVYRAHDTSLGRDVALKVCAEEQIADPDSRTRFRREVESCAALAHPGIVRVFDFGESDGRLFYTVELLDGSDLGRMLEDDGPLAPQRAPELLVQAADALA